MLAIAIPGSSSATSFTDLASFQLAAGSPLNVEYFDTAPWPESQGEIGQSVENMGVSWNSINRFATTAAVSMSGATSVSDLDGSPDSFDEITATIMLPGVTAFGGHIHNFFHVGQSDIITLTAYDEFSNILDSVSTGSVSDFDFIGVTTNIDIKQVVFSSSGPGRGDDFAIDNVFFTQVVPEPGTASLVALGVCYVALGRREHRLSNRKHSVHR